MTESKAYCLPKTTSIDDLTLTTVTVPKPEKGQVLVRIRAVSLNFRDLVTVIGKYAFPAIPNLIPGSDSAGEVVEVGEGVTKFKAGDKVVNGFFQDWIAGKLDAEGFAKNSYGGGLQGTLTQFKIFEQHSLVIAPKNLSFEEASTLTCAALTAYNALFTFQPIGPTSWVLVLGTGGVSIAGAQIALAAGSQVILTSSSDDKIEKVKKILAGKPVHFINYKTHPDWEKEVRRITNGRGVDHVLEIGGGTLRKSIQSTTIEGSVDVIGFVGGSSEAQNTAMDTLFAACKLRGILIGSRTMLEELVALIDFHDIHPVVHEVFSFDKAKDAFKAIQSASHVGKVVIRVD